MTRVDERAKTKVRLRVLRQDGPSKVETRRWEDLSVEVAEGATVLSALLEFEKRPLASDGRTVAPVAFEASCLEGSCGSCAMLIDGRVRMACSTPLPRESGGKVTLAPLSKFPVVRDLVVDRSRLMRALDEVAFERATGSDPGALPERSPEERDVLETLSGCTSCGACLEACPEVHRGGAFVGASLLHHVELSRRKAEHPEQRGRLLDVVLGEGGLADCGKAQNCVKVCPVELPLTESIRRLSWAATKRFFVGRE